MIFSVEKSQGARCSVKSPAVNDPCLFSWLALILRLTCHFWGLTFFRFNVPPSWLILTSLSESTITAKDWEREVLETLVGMVREGFLCCWSEESYAKVIDLLLSSFLYSIIALFSTYLPCSYSTLYLLFWYCFLKTVSLLLKI